MQSAGQMFLIFLCFFVFADRAGDLRFGSPAAMAGSGINSQFGEWQNDGSVEERIPPEPPVFPSDNSEPGGADIFMPDAEPESEYVSLIWMYTKLSC